VSPPAVVGVGTYSAERMRTRLSIGPLEKDRGEGGTYCEVATVARSWPKPVVSRARRRRWWEK
jgi:hypothetical protein